MTRGLPSNDYISKKSDETLTLYIAGQTEPRMAS